MANNPAQQVLDSTRRRLLLRDLAGGVFPFMGCALLLLIAACWLDWYFAADNLFRFILWSIGSLGVLAGLIRGIVSFIKRPSKSRAAWIREGAEPWWEGRLIAGAEIEEGRLKIESELGLMLERQLEKVVLTKDRNRFPPGILSRLQWFGVAAVLLLLVITIFVLPLNEIIGRVLIPWADYPPSRRLSLSIEPGDAEAERGQPLSIIVDVTGGSPEELRIIMRMKKDKLKYLKPVKTESGRFLLYIPALYRSFEYSVLADDIRSPSYAITVLDYPRLEELTCHIKYPEYTGIEDRTIFGGPVSVLEGSIVSVEGNATTILSGAALVARNISGDILLSKEGDVRGDIFEISFQPESDGEYEITLRSREGRTNPDRYRYPIKLKPDQPPMVELIWPEYDMKEVPTAFIPVSFVARDDFGLHGACLLITLPETELRLAETVYNERECKVIEDHLLLDISELNLSPGDVFAFQVEVSDSKSQIRRSLPRFIQIIEYEEELKLSDGEEGCPFCQQLKSIYIPLKSLTEKQRSAAGAIMTARGEENPAMDNLRAWQETARQLLDRVLSGVYSEFPEGIPHQLYRIITGLEAAARRMDGSLSALDEGNLKLASSFSLKALKELCALQTQIEWIISGKPKGGGKVDTDLESQAGDVDQPPDGAGKPEKESSTKKELTELTEKLDEQSRDIEESSAGFEDQIKEWLSEERERKEASGSNLKEIVSKINSMPSEEFDRLKKSITSKSSVDQFEEMGISEKTSRELSDRSGAAGGREIADALNEFRKMSPKLRNKMEYEMSVGKTTAGAGANRSLPEKVGERLRESFSASSSAGELAGRSDRMPDRQFKELAESLRKGAGAGKFTENGLSPGTADELSKLSGGQTGARIARMLEDLRNLSKIDRGQSPAGFKEKKAAAGKEARSSTSPELSGLMRGLSDYAVDKALSRLSRHRDSEIAGMLSELIESQGREEKTTPEGTAAPGDKPAGEKKIAPDKKAAPGDKQGRDEGITQAEKSALGDTQGTDEGITPVEKAALGELAGAFLAWWEEKFDRNAQERAETLNEIESLAEEIKLDNQQQAALREMKVTGESQLARLEDIDRGTIGSFRQWVMPGETLFQKTIRRFQSSLGLVKPPRQALKELAARLKRKPVPERYKDLVFLYYRHLMEIGENADQ